MLLSIFGLCFHNTDHTLGEMAVGMMIGGTKMSSRRRKNLLATLRFSRGVVTGCPERTLSNCYAPKLCCVHASVALITG